MASWLDRVIAWLAPTRAAASGDGAGRAGPGGEGGDEGDAAEAHPSDEPVVVPIEESIDLHHFAPRDIPSVVAEYLREARRAGLRDVRIIHGKGKGVQRQRVRTLLEKHPFVLAFVSDGLGSTLVELAPSKRRPPGAG